MDKIQVYPAEVYDGLADQVATASLRIEARLSVVSDAVASGTRDAVRASIKNSVPGINQEDLAVIQSILVSTGWNLNDDIFLGEELVPAKDSPVHKPINVEHDSVAIIGHLVRADIVDKHGNEIVGDPPADFDIETIGVLYKGVPALAGKVEDVISGAKLGKKFVSMEAWFHDFDYGFMKMGGGSSDAKEMKVIKRDESTAFLTKHLRRFGGDGTYQGYRIGMVLRKLHFAGKGIVAHPANPESVIKEIATQKVVATETNGDWITMDRIKELEAQIAELQKQGTADKATIDALTREKNDLVAKVAALPAQVSEALAAHDKSVKELQATHAKEMAEVKAASDKQVKGAAEKYAELDKSAKASAEKVVALEKQIKDANEQLAKIAKAAKVKERIEALTKQSKKAPEEKLAAEVAEMSDEVFAALLRGLSMTTASASDGEEEAVGDDDASRALAAALDEVDVDEGEKAAISAASAASKAEADALAVTATATAKRLMGRDDEEAKK